MVETDEDDNIVNDTRVKLSGALSATDISGLERTFRQYQVGVSVAITDADGKRVDSN